MAENRGNKKVAENTCLNKLPNYECDFLFNNIYLISNACITNKKKDGNEKTY